MARVALVILMCCYKSVRWLLEQPSGSILPEHPRWAWLNDRVDVPCLQSTCLEIGEVLVVCHQVYSVDLTWWGWGS